MQLDPAMLKKVLSMNDGELWRTVCAIAGQSGLKLPSQTPSAAEMQKLRATLGSVTDRDVAEAIRMVQNFKNGEKKHE